MQCVLLQTLVAVAHLHKAKLTLDHPKRVLDIGSDAGVDLLHLVDQRVSGLVLSVQRFALVRAHSHMPGDILVGILALVSSLVARIIKVLHRAAGYCPL